MKTKSEHVKRATSSAHEYVLYPRFFIKNYSHGDFYGVLLSLLPMQGSNCVPATLYRCTTQKLLSKKR